MKPISRETFQKFFNNPPHKKYDYYLRASKISPIKEHLHFLSQIAHESNFLRHNRESFMYSANRLKLIFPKYFKNLPLTVIKNKYERKKAALDRAYQLRLGNGPEKTGDGGDFRGIFYIQLTGKNNWKKYDVKRFTKPADEFKNWIVCLEFWRMNKIDSLCDDNWSDLSDREVKKITRKINGGYNGYNDRLKKADRIEKYFKLKQMM